MQRLQNGFEHLDWIIEERMLGYLDPGIEKLLDYFNSFKAIETTSSCVGRISIIESRFPWERREDSRIVFKKHSEVTPEEIAQVMVRFDTTLWLKVTGPILHLRVYKPECVSEVLRAARISGFKHSGAISVSDTVIVEIHSPTQMIVPLKINGLVVLRGDALRSVTRMANDILKEGRSRLDRLIRNTSNESFHKACDADYFSSY